MEVDKDAAELELVKNFVDLLKVVRWRKDQIKNKHVYGDFHNGFEFVKKRCEKDLII